MKLWLSPPEISFKRLCAEPMIADITAEPSNSPTITFARVKSPFPPSKRDFMGMSWAIKNWAKWWIKQG
ncbi:MAG: hypothetical protein HQ519_14000 [Planctomycetes bacterium]|nr:hypothetical protein [Planctomycetota bacterium]